MCGVDCDYSVESLTLKSDWNRKDDLCVVLKVQTLKLNIGDWSNGMRGVSKTVGGSSILSSPVL